MQNGILRLIFKVHFCATALVIRFLFAARKYRLGPCIAAQERICALFQLLSGESEVVNAHCAGILEQSMGAKEPSRNMVIVPARQAA